MGDQQFPVFIVTVIWIVESDLARIVKTTSGFLKSDTVFSYIGLRLLRIPFERNQYSLILLILAILPGSGFDIFVLKSHSPEILSL